LSPVRNNGTNAYRLNGTVHAGIQPIGTRARIG